MKRVFHLNIQIGKINSDLYFEDMESAECTAEFLKEMLTKNAKVQLKINATIHEVYSKEAAAENIRTGLCLVQFSSKN